MQRGPGYKPTYWEEYIRKYHDQGLDSETIAYRIGMSGSEVRAYLGRKLKHDRESKAKEKAEKIAWRRIVEKKENFYKVRDFLKINTSYLCQLLREGFYRHGEEDRSFDLQYDDRHDYAVLVYEESNRSLYDVSKALEVRSKEAKQILDNDYDPYADYHWEESDAILERVKELHESGRSYAQIDWIMRKEYIDSESMLNPKPLSEMEIVLQKELEERLASGEHLDSISRDTGISESSLLEKLEGKYEHPLDLYGLGRPERDELGRLYLENGYEPDEIAILLKTDEKSVRYCINEFYYRISDKDAHDESSYQRWSDPNAKKVLAPEAISDPVDEKKQRAVKSSQTAERYSIDEDKASRFFEGGLLPTRAEIAQDRDMRASLARAMFDQGKDVEKIASSFGLSIATVKQYLAKELAIIREEESKSRSNVSSAEISDATYAAIVSSSECWDIPREQGGSIVLPRMQPRIIGPWYAATQCEARRLIAFSGLSLLEVSFVMKIQPSKLSIELGSFCDTPRPLSELRLHAVAAFLYDCLSMNQEDIGEILGIGPSVVYEFLDDGRRTPESRWWREPPHYGNISAENMSDACGIDAEILERASRAGLFSNEEKEGWGSIKSIDALKVMGLFNPKPFKFAVMMEECDE